MFDFLIGTRFYYQNKYVEVTEGYGDYICNKCALFGNPKNCHLICCYACERKDKTAVYLKEIKDEF